MKKAKIVLSAVAVFAVIGGAFAFKASRTLNTFYSSSTNGICSVTFKTTYTTDLSQPGAAFTTRLATTQLTTVCPTITVKAIPE